MRSREVSVRRCAGADGGAQEPETVRRDRDRGGAGDGARGPETRPGPRPETVRGGRAHPWLRPEPIVVEEFGAGCQRARCRLQDAPRAWEDLPGMARACVRDGAGSERG